MKTSYEEIGELQKEIGELINTGLLISADINFNYFNYSSEPYVKLTLKFKDQLNNEQKNTISKEIKTKFSFVDTIEVACPPSLDPQELKNSIPSVTEILSQSKDVFADNLKDLIKMIISGMSVMQRLEGNYTAVRIDSVFLIHPEMKKELNNIINDLENKGYHTKLGSVSYCDVLVISLFPLPETPEQLKPYFESIL
jgi:hypothetical protein